ncbi:MAG TPA: GNAT family N-acetyltransferase [Candidatus Binatia bacterium]|nr:GNAT family N-acetyltransferase [Candidatus Binatia bacterium]
MDRELTGRICRLRQYRSDDAEAVRALADDYAVARWMTRAFPHPYRLEDAREWIALSLSRARGPHFAVEVDGALAGGIGFQPLAGERSGCALFGYWLGRKYWGRGVGTDAATTLADAALASGIVYRLEATVFAENVASARVLEKSGFGFEATMRGYYLDRDDRVCDGLLYARVEEPASR